MISKDKEALKKQLNKIKDIASCLPTAYAYSLTEAADAISEIVMKEGEGND